MKHSDRWGLVGRAHHSLLSNVQHSRNFPFQLSEGLSATGQLVVTGGPHRRGQVYKISVQCLYWFDILMLEK
jgi:hypothetical protein